MLNLWDVPVNIREIFVRCRDFGSTKKNYPKAPVVSVGSTKNVTEDGRLHWADLCEISPVI